MKMPNNLFRKGLVIGVICLLLLMSPVIPAFSIQDRNNEEILESQGEPLPDLTISHVNFDYETEEPGWFEVVVLNEGDGEVPGGWRKHNLRVYYDYAGIPSIPYFYGAYSDKRIYYQKEPQHPGETDTFIADVFRDNGLGPDVIVRIAFWINPMRDIKESNYRNNGVWAYYIIGTRDFSWADYTRISAYHTWTSIGPPLWYPPGKNIEDNHLSQTTQQQTTQQATNQQSASKQDISNQQILSEELIETPVKIFDENGVTEHTVMLTQQQFDELDALTDIYMLKLKNSESLEETVSLHCNLLESVNEFGIFPNDRCASELKEQFIKNYDIAKAKTLEIVENQEQTGQIENFFCYLSSHTSWMGSDVYFPFPIHFMKEILWSLGIGLFVDIYYGSYDEDSGRYPCEGWVSTDGTLGKKSIDGPFYGQIAYVNSGWPELWYYIGAKGFIGYVIWNWSWKMFGYANHVNIGPNPIGLEDNPFSQTTQQTTRQQATTQQTTIQQTIIGNFLNRLIRR